MPRFAAPSISYSVAARSPRRFLRPCLLSLIGALAASCSQSTANPPANVPDVNGDVGPANSSISLTLTGDNTDSTVRLNWSQINDPSGEYDSYIIYRALLRDLVTPTQNAPFAMDLDFIETDRVDAARMSWLDSSALSYGARVEYRIAAHYIESTLGLSPPSNTVFYDIIHDLDGDGVREGDCADNNAAVSTGATEVCDGLDNNCNGVTDDIPGRDDSDPCTIVVCDFASGGEVRLPIDDATPCSNGNPCDGTETCRAGVCTAGSPLVCDDGVDCTGDVCETTAGCKHLPIDADCDDGIACTLDTCDRLLGCLSTPQNAVCDDDNLCNGSETCDASHGCQNAAAAAPDRTPCGGGLLCAGGLCRGLHRTVATATPAPPTNGTVLIVSIRLSRPAPRATTTCSATATKPAMPMGRASPQF